MAIDLPSSPSVDDIYSNGVGNWKWDGVSWRGIAPAAPAVDARRLDFIEFREAAADDVEALSDIIDYLNANGSTASANINWQVTFPPRAIDLRGITSGFPALTVSNVMFQFDGAILRVRDERLFKLGDSTHFIENIIFDQPFFQAAYGETKTSNQCCIWGENCTRVRGFGVEIQNIRRLFGCDIASGKNVSAVWFHDTKGTSLYENHLIDVKNVNGGNGAGIGLVGATAIFAVKNDGTGPDHNPPIVPATITGITLSNPISVTTDAAHGFLTGDKVRFRNVVGTTELNGNDYTITKTGSTTFTLDGINGTSGYTAFSTIGFVAMRHFTHSQTCAAIHIEGQWDTVIFEGLGQHYTHMFHLKSNGPSAPITYVIARNFVWDYGGRSLMSLEVVDEGIANIWVDGWCFTLDGDVFEITDSGTGLIAGLTVNSLIVGLAGGGIFNDPSFTTIGTSLSNIAVHALHRLASGTRYDIRCVSATRDLTCHNIRFEMPVDRFGGVYTNDLLIGDVGIGAFSSATHLTVTDCVFNQGTALYSVPGTGSKFFDNNRKTQGGFLDHVDDSAPTVTTGTYTYKNGSGQIQMALISGGTVTSVKISGYSGDTEVATGTDVTVVLGREQTLTIVNSSAPTLKLIPIQ